MTAADRASWKAGIHCAPYRGMSRVSLLSRRRDRGARGDAVDKDGHGGRFEIGCTYPDATPRVALFRRREEFIMKEDASPSSKARKKEAGCRGKIKKKK